MVKLMPMLMKLVNCEFEGASVVYLKKEPLYFMDLYGFAVYLYDWRLWVKHPGYNNIYLCIGKSLYKDELELIRNLQAVFACLNIKTLKQSVNKKVPVEDCNSYQNEKQPRVLKEGRYFVKLGLAYEIEVKDYKILRFPFTVEGETKERIPNYFDLFYPNNDLDDFKFRMFCSRLYRIVECFRLTGELSKEYYPKWVGKTGEVQIKESEKGFMKVSLFFRKDFESRPAFYYGKYKPVWFI